ncbi:hypothetical protein [Salsipaludibacter albus]|uniref:hypothetical protein n=1 Tax=Salsipaludibacter albus TaxID=2849650 RepID=UPI001EE3B28F|nr:hypothetical protein [Salsipaludibacter albus]MBY5161192.1 hypothetical protein [Salsipaludibacter albus]
MTTETAAPTMTGQGLFHDWVVALSVGEAIGFVPPALAGATLATAGVADSWLVVGLTVAGVVEGVAIGVFGARVLARHLPDVDRVDWVVATALAAGLAWFLGMGGSAVLGAADDHAALVLVAVVPAWFAGLLAMGYAQWLVLRRVVARASRWIWVSAGAWLVGVAIPVTALSVVPNDWPAAGHLAVGVVSAVAMGATVAVLTGATLVRLVVAAHPGGALDQG